MDVVKRTGGKPGVRRFHLALSWIGGLTLLVWGISGAMHPLMSWSGPEATHFFPPRLEAELSRALPPAEILKRAGVARARIVKALPSFDGAVLQITGDGAERRYFSLEDGRELADRDRQQAIWLARYYTGLEEAPLASVRLQKAFDGDYPWVNRLLPVWRIEFATPDARRAYIYTELNSLAAQHDRMREWWLSIFQTLHTWRWLSDFDGARVLIIALLMASLSAMAATGIAMVLSFKPRRIAQGDRRWHRRIAYAIWLPILLQSVSGSYHLLHLRYADNSRGLRLGPPMELGALADDVQAGWRAALASGAANALSLIEGPEGFLYRVERPAEDLRLPSREERFRGKAGHGGVDYFEIESGRRLEAFDRIMAATLAMRLASARPEQITGIEPVHQFSIGYDFRNKRLPVWQITLNDERSRMLFVDTSAGLLVDQANRFERLEGLSFGMLHKWNFLHPLGTNAQNAVVVAVVAAACLFAGLGYSMALGSRRRQRGRDGRGKILAPDASGPSRRRRRRSPALGSG